MEQSDNKTTPRRLPFDITSAQRRALRAQGHSLKAFIRVGQKGLTDEFVASVQSALADHELIKVTLGEEPPTVRKVMAAELAERRAALAQVIGRVACFIDVAYIGR